MGACLPFPRGYFHVFASWSPRGVCSWRLPLATHTIWCTHQCLGGLHYRCKRSSKTHEE